MDFRLIWYWEVLINAIAPDPRFRNNFPYIRNILPKLSLLLHPEDRGNVLLQHIINWG
jgi:hypothetical protein